MKNLKNNLMAFGLVVILGVGAVTAKAEISISDNRTEETKTQCSAKNDGLLGQLAGIIVYGFSGVMMPEGLVLIDESCSTDEVIPSEVIVSKGYRKC